MHLFAYYRFPQKQVAGVEVVVEELLQSEVNDECGPDGNRKCIQK